MKAFIVLILLSGLQTQAQQSAKAFLDAALTRLTNARDYTTMVAELMPENKYDFKPTKEEMSFGEQIRHMAGNLYWLSSSYLSKEPLPSFDTTKKKFSKNEIITELKSAYSYTYSAVSKMISEQLSDTVTFFAGPMNKLQIINLINDHQAHHRGQCIVYLRLNGIKPPDYIGW
jgi:uncharacterized damage-inducible protein DinB